jgi:hypothetical protein
MANKINIDVKSLVNWAPGVTYRIEVETNLVTEVGNNRSPSPAVVQNFDTFSAGPSVTATSPVNNTATSLSSVVTLTYNRPFFTGTGNFYIYRDDVNTTTNTLIATLGLSSNRITASGNKNVITTNGYTNTGQFGSEFLPSNQRCWIFSDLSLYPIGTQFTINGTGNYEITNLTQIFSNTGIVEYSPPSSVTTTFLIEVVTKAPTVTINLQGLILPESTYFISADEGVLIDMFSLDSLEIADDSVFKYTPGPATQIVSTVPPFGQTNQFVNSATIVYNRLGQSIGTGTNYYLNYESSGTVKTFPVTSSIVTNGQPLSTSTALQLRLENNFIDDVYAVTTATNSGSTWSTSSRFSSYSLDFGSDATQTKFVAMTSSNLNFGTEPFTIEAWIFPPLAASQSPNFYHTIFANSANSVGLYFSDNGNNYELFFGNSTGYSEATPSAGAIKHSQWNHVFFQRSGGQTRMGVNGTVYTVSNFSDFVNFNNFRIGGTAARGLIDSVRVSSAAIYPTSGSYTQPTAEFSGAVTSATTVLNFSELNLPEGEYFITNDAGVFIDQFNFPALPITDNSKIKWNNTVISNMDTRRYRGDSPYALFTATTPQVLDIPLTTSTQYTFTLESPIGEFSSANGGIDAGSYWTFTGTKTQINDLISSIRFTSNTATNNPSTYTYSLSKGGVTLVNKTRDLLGILLLLGAPGPTGKAFPRLVLGVEGTRSTDEPLTLTANISTSTTMSGVIVFKADNSVIATVPISTSGFATTVTTFSSTGSRFISASWPAETLINGSQYEPLDSFDNRITIDTAAVFSGTISLNAVNLSSRRLPIGPPVDLLAQLTENSTGSSTMSFVEVVPQTTTTSFTSATSLTITASGERYVEVNNTSTVRVSDWLKISGNMTGIGSISSNYQVSSIAGNRINFGARSEDDNLYYWYDPLKEAVTPGITVAFDPIVYQATFTKPGFNRLSSTTLSTATVVNNSATYTTSFASTGTKYIVADWSGTSTFPKYFAKSSELIEFEIAERADYNGTLLLNLNTSTVGQFEAARYSVQLSTPETTTGTITFNFVSSLGTGTYSTVGNTSDLSSVTTPVLRSTLLSSNAVFGENIRSSSSSTVRTNIISTTSNTSTTINQFIDVNLGNVSQTTYSTTTVTLNVSTATSNETIVGPYYGFNLTVPVVISNPERINQRNYIRYTIAGTANFDERLAQPFFINTLGRWWSITGLNVVRNPNQSSAYTYGEIQGLTTGTLTPLTVQPAVFPSSGSHTVRSGQLVSNYLNTLTITVVNTGVVSRIESNISQYTEQQTIAAPFVNGTATFVLSSGTFNTTSTVLGSNKLTASWNGQTYVANQFYPYYGIQSSTATQQVTPVSLSLTGTSIISQIASNTLTVTLNTSTALPGTVSIYKDNVKLVTTSTNNNTAVVTLSSSTFVVGSNQLRAVWDATYPASFSNTLDVSSRIYDIAQLAIKSQPLTYQAYSNNNVTSINTASITISANDLTSFVTPYYSNLITLISGVTRVLSPGFGPGSTSAEVYTDRRPLAVGQSILINGQSGYTISALSGATPYITILFTPAIPGNVLTVNLPPVAPSGVVRLVDSVSGVISTATLVNSNGTISTATFNWFPFAANQSFGFNNLSIEFDGDYWYAPSNIETTLQITARTSPNLAFTASSLVTINGQVAAGSYLTMAATKPSGFAFVNPVSFIDTTNDVVLNTATFVNNTATAIVNTLTAGSYVLRCDYGGDQFSTTSTSNTVNVTIFKDRFGSSQTANDITYPNSSFDYQRYIVKSQTANLQVNYGFGFPWNLPFPTGTLRFSYRYFDGVFYEPNVLPVTNVNIATTFQSPDASKVLIFIDRTLLSIGQSVQIDGVGGYTITSITPTPNSSLTTVGISPSYSSGARPQIFSGAFGVTSILDRKIYNASFTIPTSDFTTSNGGLYQIRVQYNGDNVWNTIDNDGPVFYVRP